ncbi:YybS family protein [Litchfieldia salsa]|uniref:Uncharacterized conserved protein YybS, DUF2232 family n=1 Tax=Litchfieldia salsa TaxID=930152 RepID=A0A1H0UE27_9BACI|nr:YybS family protein [Litchfieldia salsa]SDP64434.1 Uncharacterized conserved protein YybS, DUF2232 family [Litchfieldia salsa]
MKNQKFIVDGGLLLAIYILMLLGATFVPFLGIILTFLLPIPFVIFASRYDIRRSILFLVAATILSLLFTSVSGLVFSLIYGVGGVVYGILVQKNKKSIEVLLGLTVSFMITFVIIYVAASTLFSFDFTALILQSAEESIELMRQLGTQNEAMIKQFEESLEVFKYLLPSLLVITAFMFALITQLVTYPVLRRVVQGVNKLPAIREITLPLSIIWYYLTVLILMFFEMEVGTFYYMAVTNLFYILQLLMVIQGISFIFFFSHVRGLPKIVPIIIVLMTPFLLSIIRILGIIDLGFQLRKKIKPKS